MVVNKTDFANFKLDFDKDVLDQLWNLYAIGMPRGCTDVQFRETKKAFYGGLGAMFMAMNEASKFSEDESVEICDRIYQGLQLPLREMGDPQSPFFNKRNGRSQNQTQNQTYRRAQGFKRD